MAKADIGPKIGIEGEAQFKKQLKDINTGLKTLGSEMKAVTSEFIGNENSVEALSAENDVLGRTINSLNEKLNVQKSQLQASAQAYGIADERTQKLQQAVNNTTAELNKAEAQVRKNTEGIGKLTEEQEKNSRSLKANGESVGVGSSLLQQFGLDVDSVGKKLGLSTEQTAQLSDALAGGGISGGVALAAGATVAITAVILLAEAVKKAAEFMKSAVLDATDFADSINTISQQSGFSTEFLQGLEYASELVDVSADAIVGSMRKLKKNLFSESADVRAAFDELNIIPEQLIQQQVPMEEIFRLVIGGLSHVGNELERDNIAMTLFGKPADELAGVIDDGGEKLYSLIDGFSELGYILSDEQLAALSALDDQFVQFDNELAAVKNQVAAEMAPALLELAQQLLEVARTVDWKEFGTAAAQVISDLTPLIVDLAQAIADAANALADLMNAVGEFKNSGVGQGIASGVKTTAKTLLGSIPGVGTLVQGYNLGSAAYSAAQNLVSRPIVVQSNISLDNQTLGRALTPVIDSRKAQRGNVF